LSFYQISKLSPPPSCPPLYLPSDPTFFSSWTICSFFPARGIRTLVVAFPCRTRSSRLFFFHRLYGADCLDWLCFPLSSNKSYLFRPPSDQVDRTHCRVRYPRPLLFFTSICFFSPLFASPRNLSVNSVSYFSLAG